jgi:hypothetical protein
MDDSIRAIHDLRIPVGFIDYTFSLDFDVRRFNGYDGCTLTRVETRRRGVVLHFAVRHAPLRRRVLAFEVTRDHAAGTQTWKSVADLSCASAGASTLIESVERTLDRPDDERVADA